MLHDATRRMMVADSRETLVEIVDSGDGGQVQTIELDPGLAEAWYNLGVLLAADRLAENPAISGNTYFISQDDPISVWDMINAILKAAELEPNFEL